MSEQKQLFNNFPPITTKQWMDRITADLRCDDFSKKMVWKTAEGFSLMPFYREEDIKDLPAVNSLPGETPYLRGTSSEGSRWLVRQNIEVEDYTEANRKALEILMKGVDSIGFIIKDPESVNKEAIGALLRGIHTESIEINFICEGKAKEILRYFISAIEQKGIDKEKIKGTFEADPLGRLFLNGKLCISFEAGLDYLADLTKESLSLKSFRTVQVNGPWLSEAGADIIAELAFALSMGN
jgi:methylmalonyl-CoA mutase